jgi:hypothetical protein
MPGLIDLQIGKPYLPVRHVEWGFLGSKVVLEDTGAPSSYPVSMYVWSDRLEFRDGQWYPVPPELLAAFRAGEDWRPCVDWLIETYPDKLGWLATAVAEGAES